MLRWEDCDISVRQVDLVLKYFYDNNKQSLEISLIGTFLIYFKNIAKQNSQGIEQNIAYPLLSWTLFIVYMKI
jgi:hypothetical protein